MAEAMLPSLMLLRMRVYALSRGDARIDVDAVVVVVEVMELVAVAMAVLASIVVVLTVLAEMECWSMSSVSW